MRSFDNVDGADALDLLLSGQARAADADGLLRALASHARNCETNVFQRRRLDPGLLIEKGASVPHVFVLIDGALTVAGGGAAETGAGLIATLHPPAIVGEIARLAGRATATVRVAPGGATVLAMSQEAFDRFLDGSRDAWQHYRHLVSERLIQQLLETRRVAPDLSRALLRLVSGSSGEAGSEQQAIVAKMAEDILLTDTDLFEWHHYAPGETIIDENEPLEHVSVLVRGRAIVRTRLQPDIVVGPGALLGETSALTGMRPTATVVAAEAAELLALSRAQFQARVLSDAEARARVRTLALERLRQLYQGARLDSPAEERLRVVRDQNTDALIRRRGIRLTAGDGLFRVLNPTAVPIQFTDADRGELGAIGQKYQLLGAAERLLKCGLGPDAIMEMAARVRSVSASGAAAHEHEHAIAARAVHDFLESVDRVRAATFGGATAALPDRPARESLTVVERIQRIRWLEDRLLEDPLIAPVEVPQHALDDHLRAVAGSDDPAQAIDRQFRSLMELGVRQGSERLFSELSTVMFERVEVAVHEFDDGVSRAALTPRTSDDHPALRQLRERLARGEQSAIGGAAYPLQRFTKAALDAVAAGEINVVVYNGDAAGAERYVRDRYGKDPTTGAVWPGWTTAIQGLDGSGPRTLLSVKAPGTATRQHLIIAGHGASRQLHNAGAILLYEDEAGRRVPPNHLRLASGGLDYVERCRGDILRAVEDQERHHDRSIVLGSPVVRAGALPIQLVLLQNPQEWVRAFGDAVTLSAAPEALFRFYAGFARIEGALVRLLVPKVGGDGLYGDTAGSFVTAAYTAGLDLLLPHVLFNGTAGGFAGTAGTAPFRACRGLGAIRPGGLIVPLETIEQVGDGAGPRRLRTLFDPAQVPEAQPGAGPGIHFSSHHAAVVAPAIETYTFIDEELVARGKASVDVEGGAIWSAIEALDRPAMTFTPVYTHSDDPRGSRREPDDSLAAMGPWFEGVELDTKKYEVLGALIRRSLASAATR